MYNITFYKLSKRDDKTSAFILHEREDRIECEKTQTKNKFARSQKNNELCIHFRWRRKVFFLNIN